MPLRLDQKSDDFEAKFEEFVAAKRDVEEDVDSTAAEIIEAVRRDGDKAVAAFTEKFDRLSLASSKFAVDPAEMDAAVDECDDATIEALKTAATRIRAFHETQRPDAMEYVDEAGVRLGARWTALEAVGLYVPGGTASYPSSVLMNAIPAQVAGVERIVMVVPTPDGNITPLVLAAAKLGGVHEIYRIGGAQAVAALAYGTETIR
ncbi:MAG: histidinol dehydrogenase, partial [Pseudomonadota bacterium]|nr:histidinol dehydrogenase [Pseudomonadota bacterium]